MRDEYAHLDDDDFRAGRAQLLEGLADKANLFHTRHAGERWEGAARANLRREIAELVELPAGAPRPPSGLRLASPQPERTRRATSSRLVTGTAPAATTAS